MLSSVKEALTKEIDVKEFLEMEVELTKLKQLLATEIKFKEFLLKQIDLGNLLSKKSIEISTSEEILNNNNEISGGVQKKLALPDYDYTLVETLHGEHKRIRYIFNKIMTFTLEKKYEKVARQLEIFSTEIRQHYQKVDIELYAYLKRHVQINHPKREKAFTQLSLEMKNISIEIYYIISQSSNIPLVEKTYSGFMKEFMIVGKLLNERLLREESVLFKMYQETNTAKDIA